MRILILVASLVSLLSSWRLLATEIQPIMLDETREEVLIGPSSYVYDDASKELDFAAVQKLWAEGTFKKENAADPNYGVTGHAYWFRFSAKNPSEHKEDWYFGLEYPLVKNVDLYISKPDGTWEHRDSGNRNPFKQRDLKNRFIYLKTELNAGEQKEFFVRLQTDGASEFRLRFRNLAGIYAADHDVQFFLGGFNCLMVFLAAYYLLLTLNSRQVDVLWMGIFFASQFLFRMTINGYSFEYLFAGSPSLNQYAMGFCVPLVFGTAMANAHWFLPMRKYPKLGYITKGFMAINFFFVAASFFLPYKMVKIYTLVGMLTAFAIIVVSISIQAKGFRPARYFVYSWILVLLGSITYGLQKLGIIPVSFITTYGVEISIALQGVLMSLGVSDKIKETNKKLAEAQEAALKAQIETNRLQEEMNTSLERQVRERTEELWVQTKGMEVILENLNQGICKIDAKFGIHPQYSPFLEQIVGERNLKERSLEDVLFAKCEMTEEISSLMETTVSSAVGEPGFQFETNSHLLPREVMLTKKGTEKYLEVDWAAIEDKEGNVDRLLVAIRDVTLMKKAEKEAQEKQEELETIGKILDLSATKFRRFVKSASLLIEEARQKLDASVNHDAWRILLRNVHTIKGNARTYKLDDLSSLVHEVENKLFDVNADQLKPEDATIALDGLNQIEAKITYYQRIHDDKLKRGAAAETEAVMVQASRMISDVWGDIRPDKQKQYLSVLRRIDAMNTNSLKKVIQPLLDSLPGLAAQLQKASPTVKITGSDFFIDPDHLNLYEDIFVHMFRNSLDHGFMQGDEGRINLEIKQNNGQTELLYFDSGRGLNLPVLRKKALERGHIKEGASDQDVADTIFLAGVSSAKVVTEISGRGVGMDAVKGCVERLHGQISIRLTGEGTLPDHQRFEFRIVLPQQVPVLELNDCECQAAA